MLLKQLPMVQRKKRGPRVIKLILFYFSIQAGSRDVRDRDQKNYTLPGPGPKKVGPAHLYLVVPLVILGVGTVFYLSHPHPR